MRAVPLCLAVLFLQSMSAAVITFNAATPADNAATRASWLAAIGIAVPENLVDFEAGFVNNQNISGVGGLFPDGLVITDTSAAGEAIIRTGAVIGGSTPAGSFAVTQNELPFLVLDFSADPIDYVGFLDIDQAGTTGVITFVGGGTEAFGFETTAVGGASGEFFGIFRGPEPAITRIELDASGDGRWAVDNIEYGSEGNTIPEPSAWVLTLAGLCALAWRRRAA